MAELPESPEYSWQENSVGPPVPIPARAKPAVIAEGKEGMTSNPSDSVLSQMDRAAGAPLTSARGMAAADALVEPPEIPDETEHIEADGQDWVIRVLGSSGGSRRSSAPLLLLGFWKSGEEDGPNALETLTVGRTMSGLSRPTLEHALSVAWPPTVRPDRPRDSEPRKRGGNPSVGKPRRR